MEGFDFGQLLSGVGATNPSGVMSTGLPADWWPALLQKLQDPNTASILAAQAAPPPVDAPMPVPAETSTPVNAGPPAGTPPLLPPATPPMPVNSQGQYDPAPRGNFDLPAMQQKASLGALLQAGAGFVPKPVAPPNPVNPGGHVSVGNAAQAKHVQMGTPLAQRHPNLGMTLGQLLGGR